MIRRVFVGFIAVIICFVFIVPLPQGKTQIIDETTGWRLVEVDSFKLPVTMTDVTPQYVFQPENFIVYLDEERRPTFASLQQDLYFQPGGEVGVIDKLFTWRLSQGDDYGRRWFNIINSPGTRVVLNSSQPVCFTGDRWPTILRFSVTDTGQTDPDENIYNIERLPLYSEEDPHVIFPTPTTLRDIPHEYFSGLPWEIPFTLLNEYGEPKSIFGYWSDPPDRELAIVDFSSGTVSQPLKMEDWDSSRFHTVLAYDYRSGISLWFEPPPGEQVGKFAFRDSGGKVTYYGASEIGLSRDDVSGVIIFGESYPPLITSLGLFVNTVDGTPVGYFRLGDTYMGIRISPEKPENGWVLWANRIHPIDALFNCVGRLNPSPEVGPGDIWTLWNQDGEIQLVDLGTGNILFTGILETTPWESGFAEDTCSTGTLSISDIDGELPQEICWFDSGAWTLRIYRLEPPS